MIWRLLGKAAYYITYPVLYILGKVYRHRVRVLVVSNSGKVLLLRTWLGKQRWSLPGGGVGRHETPQAAAVRELAEETGIKTSTEDLSYVGDLQTSSEGVNFLLSVYELHVLDEALPQLPRRYTLEIIDRKWCDSSHLPKPHSEVVEWVLSRKLG